MKTILAIFGGVLLLLVGLFAAGFIAALPIKLLWNYLVPELFHLSPIGYWQAFALFYLCGLLFKSFTPSIKD